MRTDKPAVIAEPNLSLAWARAPIHVMGQSSPGPLVITFDDFSSGEPVELPDFRRAVDGALAVAQKVSVSDNAAMIFPWRTWVSHSRPSYQWLFDRYKERILPRLQRLSRRRRQNWYGTYFGRMIQYTGTKSDKIVPVNQLEHILGLWDRGRKRKQGPRVSAMQLACFDPAKDHTGQLLRGFPCLQQIGLAFESGGLAVHAFYPMQYIFDRGYGNYLGLSHLGLFMAHEMGLNLSRVSCYVTAPALGGDNVNRRSLRNLERMAVAALEANGEAIAGPLTSGRGVRL